MARHLIKQQVIEAMVGDHGVAQEVQEELSYVYKRHVIPELDSLFDELDSSEEVIRIPKLELDIGHLRLDTLREDFPRKIIAAIEDEIRKAVHENRASRSDQIRTDFESSSLKGKKVAFLDAFTYYLRFGTFPWNYPAKDKSFIELFRWLIKEEPTTLANVLATELRQEQAARRISYHLNEAEKADLIRLVAPSTEAENLIRLLEDLKRIVAARSFTGHTKGPNHADLLVTFIHWMVNHLNPNQKVSGSLSQLFHTISKRWSRWSGQEVTNSKKMPAQAKQRTDTFSRSTLSTSLIHFIDWFKKEQKEGWVVKSPLLKHWVQSQYKETRSEATTQRTNEVAAKEQLKATSPDLPTDDDGTELVDQSSLGKEPESTKEENTPSIETVDANEKAGQEEISNDASSDHVNNSERPEATDSQKAPQNEDGPGNMEKEEAKSYEAMFWEKTRLTFHQEIAALEKEVLTIEQLLVNSEKAVDYISVTKSRLLNETFQPVRNLFELKPNKTASTKGSDRSEGGTSGRLKAFAELQGEVVKLERDVTRFGDDVVQLVKDVTQEKANLVRTKNDLMKLKEHTNRIRLQEGMPEAEEEVASVEKRMVQCKKDVVKTQNTASKIQSGTIKAEVGIAEVMERMVAIMERFHPAGKQPIMSGQDFSKIETDLTTFKDNLMKIKAHYLAKVGEITAPNDAEENGSGEQQTGDQKGGPTSSLEEAEKVETSANDLPQSSSTTHADERQTSGTKGQNEVDSSFSASSKETAKEKREQEKTKDKASSGGTEPEEDGSERRPIKNETGQTDEKSMHVKEVRSQSEDGGEERTNTTRSKQDKTVQKTEENHPSDQEGLPSKVGTHDRRPEIPESHKRRRPAETRINRGIPWSQPRKILEEAYIRNAGLVLLWPYFTTLFKGMGWVTGDAFNSEEDRYKAIHFLQYLVVLDDPYDEADLVLNKLLCGLYAEDPVPTRIDFTAEEKEEADNLLKVVIQNWTVLKNTSVDGFRGTFLKKEGMLKKDYNGWKLYVERSTIDILLERLPWGYSVIKLPWLDQMMYVEW
ncbi:MAG: contractile injection system tape measure protein [Bacteroidota bacterium]